MQLLLVRSQQLHHGTFCTASSPGTILPAVHPSTPITFYIPDEIFDILSLCLLANKTSDWEILVIGAVAVSDGRHCRLFPHSCRGPTVRIFLGRYSYCYLLARKTEILPSYLVTLQWSHHHLSPDLLTSPPLPPPVLPSSAWKLEITLAVFLQHN